MKQHEAVERAMREAGGYATLGQLNHAALRIEGCEWKTKTPFASIRRIVQQSPKFFKIRPGLWALEAERERVLALLSAGEEAPQSAEVFDHSYYQGLLVELGNLRRFQTFVPRQDAGRKYLQRRLREVATLPQFPEFTYASLLRRGQTIDVAWFNERGLPSDFFEVEHSTDIQNSLLKFLEFQDFRVRCAIVADEVRRREFEDKMRRAAFAPLAGRVEFLGYERLARLHAAEFELEALRM